VPTNHRFSLNIIKAEAHLAPTDSKLLVPHEMAATYKMQAVQPAEASFKSWKQYVCGPADDRIWGIKPGRLRGVVSAAAATAQTQTIRK
jgi:hypothetical protein